MYIFSSKRFILISMMVATIIPISATAVRSESNSQDLASIVLGELDKDTPKTPAIVDINGNDNTNDAKNQIGGEEGRSAEDLSTPTSNNSDQSYNPDYITNNTPESRRGPVFLNLELIYIIGVVALLALLLSIFSIYVLFQIDNEIKTIKHKPAEKQTNNAYGHELELLNSRIIKIKNDLSSLLTLRNEVRSISSYLAKQKQNQSRNIPQNIPSVIPPETDLVNTNLNLRSIPQKLSIQDQLEKLISTVNSGDLNKFRDAATAELNVTDETSNSLQMGISTLIKLEKVNAGGSYLLFDIEANYFLFPTSSTLRVYNSSLTLKSLFEYETRVIPKPEIIKPAELEKNGLTWQLLSKGKLGTP